MAAIDFYKLESDQKRTIFQQIGVKLNIHPAAVEKDWWVVQTLDLISKMSVGQYIVFKGGTSLSKSWNIIERFSEDIDLVIDKKVLGIEECKTVKQVKKLRSATRKYISEAFISELQKIFFQAGYEDVQIELNTEEGENLEPVQISVIYKSHTNLSEYTLPRLKLEIGSRSLQEPYTNRQFSSLVGEYFSEKIFTDLPIEIASANPERTFLEKTFLLHEEFQKPLKNIRVNRLSRHLYDIYRLMLLGYDDIALSRKELYLEIIKHRKIYTKISGVDYNLHLPQTLNPIPPEKILLAWERDYKTMQEEMIYGDSPSFNDLIKRIQELKEKINNINWSY
ncbi:MAG: nucleotidyl transferase AbiEii/AbiGii toxin family protein [Bacteroidales bacterium]|nr:nucleotidyl transferase AbiEii/AbiGii toxin family protein [Bacteroidales bacterium]